MEDNHKLAQIIDSQDNFYISVWQRFKQTLPDFFKRNPHKTIPFAVVYILLCPYLKLEKREARKIVSKWIDLGLVELRTYSGIVLKSD